MIHPTTTFMKQLDKLNPINDMLLDQGYYFQSLFQEVCASKLLTDSQIERIQLEIIDLLGKEVERYTNGESSSIPVEKAQVLLQSITYSIGVYLKSIEMSEKIDMLKQEKISVLFYKGMDTVAAVKNRAKLLLDNLAKNRLMVNNIAYQDTIAGLSEFFSAYNIEFESHEMPGSIDYPLLETNTTLLGVEYIFDYLRCFSIENEFLNHFSLQAIHDLLMGYHKEAEHMLINLFELVLTNAIGCDLLGLKITELNIPTKDCSWLQSNLEVLNADEIKKKLEEAFDNIRAEFNLETDIITYVKVAIPQLVSRVCHNLKTNTLHELFLSFAVKSQEEESFEDGIPMEDETLRDFIEELREIGVISDKVARIQEKVRSLNDFIELLEECFYGREYELVFKMLSETERAILKNKIREEAGVEELADYIPEKEWQKILLEYKTVL
ncbi:MAG: DUF6179 domain-containing protein [Herbinix sp.]|nr:DUF6179 domain-containing protein [Herbinix sp.]